MTLMGTAKNHNQHEINPSYLLMLNAESVVMWCTVW